MPKDRLKGLFKPEEADSPERRRARQEEKLRQILAFAYSNAPAVRKKLAAAGAEPGDIKTTQDLERLPVTAKADLVRLQKADPPFGGFVTRPLKELGRAHVSPGPIYEPWARDPEDERWAEALFAAGFRAGDVGLITFAFHMAPFGFMLDDALMKLGAVAVPMGVGNTEIQVQTLRDLGAEGFLGTPSFLNTILQRIRELGLDPKKDLNLQVAFVAAEMLPESLRARLEEAFGIIVRQAYGTADVGCLGYECAGKSGWHFPEDCLVEIVDPATGRALGPGELGEVVATCFDRLYPLIRFGTGDLSSYVAEPCPCGRTSPRLTGLKGRVDQLTKVRGLFIHPGQVDQVAAKFPVLSAWRVVVTRNNHQDLMTLEVELKDQAVDRLALASGLAEALREILRLKGEVAFVAPGTIPAGAKKIEDKRSWG